MNNTCPKCITASAGTFLHRAINNYYLKFRYLLKFTTYLPSILHEMLLDHSFLHCPIFLTAASYEFSPYLSANAIDRSFKPIRSCSLGKLLISPTNTYSNLIILQRLNLYVLLRFHLSLFSTKGQIEIYYSPVRHVTYVTFNLHNVRYISSIRSEPES